MKKRLARSKLESFKPFVEQAVKNSSLENGVNAIALRSRFLSFLSTRKKFTTSPSMSLNVSIGEGDLFRRTAADPPKGSQ
jgi:hypothetical protein